MESFDCNKEDDEIDDVNHNYTGVEYIDSVNNFFKSRLRDGVLCVTEFNG